MKTCKKCKKSVANNTKICKYCGTDLTGKNIKKNKSNSSVKKEKVSKVKEQPIKEETKTEFLYTEVLEKINLEPTDLSKTEVLSFDNPKIIKNEPKKVKKEQLKALTKIDSNASDYYTFTGEKINFESLKDKRLKLSELKDKEKTKDKNSSSKTKQNKVKNKEKKKEKISETTNITRAQQIYLVKKRIIRKRIAFCFLVFVIILGFGYVGYKIYNSYEDLGHIISKKEREQNIFNMKEVITYKDVSFSIIDVETSLGTKYKRPKEGNQFLIVTISFKNNSDEKYHYSGKYFTMTNSLGEEKEKIISPVNAGNALYSGDLVIGASKEASLVFEQPIDDPDLKILYYDPFELEKYEQEVEQATLEVGEENDDSLESVEVEKPLPIYQVKIVVK